MVEEPEAKPNSTSMPREIDLQLTDIKIRLFSKTWLEEVDAEGGFPTNGDRFAAQELNKRQDTEGFTRKGFLCQALAAGWHYKSPEQLKFMGDVIGRERIQIVHGTADQMLTVPHAESLAKELGEEGGVTKRIFQGRGHVLMWEEREEFRRLISLLIDKAENLQH